MIDIPDTAAAKLEHYQEAVSAALTSLDFYLQMGLLGLAMLMALVVASVTRKYAATHPLDTSLNNRLPQHLLHALLTLAAPLTAIICFSIANRVSADYLETNWLNAAAITLSVAWLVARSLTLILHNRAIARFLTIIIFLAAFMAAAGVWNETLAFLDTLDFTLGKLRVSVLMIVKGLVLLALLVWGASTVSRGVERSLKRTSSLTYNTRELIIKFFNIILYFTVFLVTLNFVGVDLTALAVFGGAVGVGIGLGLQKIASNFISGIVLLFEKSVKAGDLVEVAGDLGWVRQLAVRHTLIETYDGREVLIPNEVLITNKVINWTYSNTRARIEILIDAAYDSDPEQVIALLLEAAGEHPRCLMEPRPACVLRELGDNALKFELTLWVADVTQGRFSVKSDVLIAILKKFRAQGIEIPFARREIFIHNNP